jgi:hypothetical protein
MRRRCRFLSVPCGSALAATGTIRIVEERRAAHPMASLRLPTGVVKNVAG